MNVDADQTQPSATSNLYTVCHADEFNQKYLIKNAKTNINGNPNSKFKLGVILITKYLH